MAASTETPGPKLIALPALSSEDPLTPTQWATLFAVADAIVPAIRPASLAKKDTDIALPDVEYEAVVARLSTLCADRGGRELVEAYLQETATQNPLFKQNVHRIFTTYMTPNERRDTLMVINLLGSRAGCLLLTGYATPIAQQPVHIREAIVQRWGTARLSHIRILRQTLTTLAKQQWLRTSNTFPRLIGFPRTPVHGAPAKGYEYEFLQIPPGEAPEVIDTDVVIVGSGCGGGVAAKNLAEGGHRVIVVERGYCHSPESFPMTDQEGFHHLFMNGGVLRSDDNCLSVLAGQTWGGGGAVNWSASLHTQGYVRQAFADTGLPMFTSAEFQTSLDRVCHRMGASTDFIDHNPANKLLLEGARKLGWAAKPVPQNTGGKRHYCGYCTFGCSACEKQGPAVSFLPDAARAGATFIEGLDVQEVLFKKKRGKKYAFGIRGIWTSRDINGGFYDAPTTQRQLIIRAKRVIVSGGTMQSPLLLLRSGLNNYNIGRHLHLHPVAMLGAVYKEEIKPWEGGILTAAVTEYENLDGKGHGVKLEAVNMLPSIFLVMPIWNGGLDYKLLASKLPYMTGYISLARDRDTGMVYPDPANGRVRVKYAVSDFDKRHILKGLIALAKIQYICGAQEIFTLIPGVSTFVRNESDDAAADVDGINNTHFQTWLREIEAKAFPAETMFGVAHQMGSCRMGTSPRSSVVDPHGKVWGTENLYVADASVLPSASGVNPMVTTMATADWITRNIERGLREEAKGGSGAGSMISKL